MYDMVSAGRGRGECAVHADAAERGERAPRVLAGAAPARAARAPRAAAAATDASVSDALFIYQLSRDTD